MNLLSLLVTSAILLTSMISCSTLPSPDPSLNLISESTYQEIISENTQHQQKYSGLYNTIDVTATILNSKVTSAQTDQYARLYLWDLTKYNEEKAKAESNLNKEASFFVSFYTPEKKHDDLNKNKTLWKIFLDVDGKRHEGKVKKIKLLTEELQGFYPFHNRFSTPYMITFSTPMKEIENKKNIKLTITGPIGSASLIYNP